MASFFAQSWRCLCPVKCIFGPRRLPENNCLWESKMKMDWFVFSMSVTRWQLSPVFCHSWLTLNIVSEVPDFGCSLFFLSSLLSPLQAGTFILHAADHSSSSLSFLPRPHLPFLLTSACSSPVPLSPLCTCVECVWVLVGSGASTAFLIPGLAALHPGCCCKHATRHHSHKGWGWKGAVLPGSTRICYMSVKQLLLRLSFDMPM